jgi:hypothetical protein
VNGGRIAFAADGTLRTAKWQAIPKCASNQNERGVCPRFFFLQTTDNALLSIRFLQIVRHFLQYHLVITDCCIETTAGQGQWRIFIHIALVSYVFSQRKVKKYAL